MATRPKLNWKRITLAVAVIFPACLLADFGFFQLKHQTLIWANGGRWCADVDEASGDVLAIFYGEVACEGGERLEQI